VSESSSRKVKKMCLETESKIPNENDIVLKSYQQMLINSIDSIFNFSIDNTKFVLKCQAEFLCDE